MKNEIKETKWYPDTYNDGEEKDIICLMEEDIKVRSSQAIFDKELWTWKYRNNNAGFFPSWIKLAKSKGRDFIGGHYTVIPVKLKANGRIILSSQSVDTLTHKSFRRQGVFIRLANFCYEELLKDEVDLIFGYPNDNSYPGFVKKLNWKHIFTVYELGYILDVPKLVNYKFSNKIKNFIAKFCLGMFFKNRQLLNHFSITKSFSYESIDINDIDSSVIDKIISKNHSYYLDRSKEYLKWRYLDNPHDKELFTRRIIKEDKIVGYYVIKFKTYPHRDNIRIAHVMELILNTTIKNIYSSVLNDIMRISKKGKATIIYTYSHDKQFDFKQYKKYGFIKLDNKNFIIRINKNKSNYKEVSDARNWFITQGDTDRA